jgi:Spy/CpxP family protein refolding chaperone
MTTLMANLSLSPAFNQKPLNFLRGSSVLDCVVTSNWLVQLQGAESMKTPIFAALAAVLGLSLAPSIAQETETTTITADSNADMIAQFPATAPEKKKFELTTEQLEKLHALKNQCRTANSAKKAELKNLNGQLRDVLTAVSVDKSAALALQSKINALHADLSNSRVSLMADSSTIFTTEQREQMHRRALMRDMGGQGFRGHKGQCGKGHGGRDHGKGGFRGRRGLGGPPATAPGGPGSQADFEAPGGPPEAAAPAEGGNT